MRQERRETDMRRFIIGGNLKERIAISEAHLIEISIRLQYADDVLFRRMHGNLCYLKKKQF